MAEFLFARDASLIPRKALLMLLDTVKRGDVRAVAQRGEASDSDVYADRACDRRPWYVDPTKLSRTKLLQRSANPRARMNRRPAGDQHEQVGKGYH